MGRPKKVKIEDSVVKLNEETLVKDETNNESLLEICKTLNDRVGVLENEIYTIKIFYAKEKDTFEKIIEEKIDALNIVLVSKTNNLEIKEAFLLEQINKIRASKKSWFNIFRTK